MPSLDTLPTEIIEEIAQHLDVAPFYLSERERRLYPRRDLLSLASACQRTRSIFFPKTWVKEHAMAFALHNLSRTANYIAPSVRGEVEYVFRVEA
jgi:hypothetical protein